MLLKNFFTCHLAIIRFEIYFFRMLACIAFLILVSLIIQTGLVALSGYLANLIPAVSKIILGGIKFILSFGLSTVPFAFIYKFMSDVKIKLRLVLSVAVFTACLFAVGKYLIIICISTNNIANTFGMASSIIVL